MNDINRASRNRDYIKRLNYLRQTYAFSGVDWGDTDIPSRIRKKLQINGAPMIITPLPPGANAENDIAWKDTYGASMDCIMSVMDGNAYNDNLLDVLSEFDSPYVEALPHAENSNLYEPAAGKQQIQFVVGKDRVDTFRAEATTPIDMFESRGLGLRAPAQMCGWGKTISMRPTDPEPLDKRVNDNEHKFDRSSWKIGPVDIRWDEKRKTWRTWNDLIVDNKSKDLGTFVFGTNPDNVCGFPFLRGKLEDVWEVRRTFREIGTETAARNDDTTKSALLTTKLTSYALQGNKIAPWSDVLICFDECIPGSPLDGVCGDETTSEAFMGILTGSNFYANPTRIGPIQFNIVQPDDIITGGMYFQGTGPCGEWVPGIQVDICEIGATEFGILVENDIAIAEGVCDVVEALFAKPGGGSFSVSNLFEKIKQNRAFIREDVDLDLQEASETKDIANYTETGFEKIQEWSEAIIDSINETMLRTISALTIGMIQSVEFELNAMQTRVLDWIFSTLQDAVASAFAACECEYTPVQVDPDAIKLGPPQAIRPRVQPPLDLSFEIGELEATQSVLDDLDKEYAQLLLDIDKATSDEEEEGEDQEATFEVEIDNPCNPDATKKVSC